MCGRSPTAVVEPRPLRRLAARLDDTAEAVDWPSVVAAPDTGSTAAETQALLQDVAHDVAVGAATVADLADGLRATVRELEGADERSRDLVYVVRALLGTPLGAPR